MTDKNQSPLRARLRAAAVRFVSARSVQRTATGFYRFYQFAAGLTILAIVAGVAMLCYAWYRVSLI